MVSSTPRPHFTPGKDPVPIVQEGGWATGPVWTGAENLAPTRIRSPDHPARSQSVPKCTVLIIPIDMSVRRLHHWLDIYGKLKIRNFCCSKNKDITLEQFKWIWWMEYGHRMWGRAIGAVFLIPAAIFWARGYFKPGMKKRIVAFGTLIALQVVIATVLKYNDKE